MYWTVRHFSIYATPLWYVNAVDETQGVEVEVTYLFITLCSGRYCNQCHL